MTKAISDKERILQTIIERLSFTGHHRRRSPTGGPGQFRLCGMPAIRNLSEMSVHFVDYDSPLVGDVVLAHMRENESAFNISIVLEVLAHGEYIVREIGSQRECHFTNMSVVPIRGLHPHDLYEGPQWVFYQKIQKAIARGQDTVSGALWHVFGGLEYQGDAAVVWIRQKWESAYDPLYSYELRFEPWSQGWSVKTILEMMISWGYGDSAMFPARARKMA